MPALLILLVLLMLPIQASASLSTPHQATRAVQARDLPAIRSSGQLRVLINQSRNSAAVVKGQSIGLEYVRLRAFEQYLNRNVGDGQKLRIKFIPTAKDQLLQALQRGEGDLVAPDELLNVRAGRDVSASRPIVRNVPLVLVSKRGNRHYQSFEQLAGRSLSLPRGSAVAQALPSINEQLALKKLPPIIIEWADPSLAVEDVLDMVQAGIFDRTVVELPIALRWAKVMPKLRIDSHLQLGPAGNISWYVRPSSPVLRANIDRFFANYQAPEDLEGAFHQVFRHLYKMHSPLGRLERQRLQRVKSVLQEQAKATGFDWLLLAALAYKESTLNPQARGVGGPIGLMQVTPAAARSVGVSEFHSLAGNVRAGSAYLAMIRQRYFKSTQIPESEQIAFSLAAYNLGPERVQSLRAEARRKGLNANQWFYQVERVAMEQMGLGVVSYVNAVNKYHVAYKRERYLLEN